MRRAVWIDGWWRHARRVASPNFNRRPSGERIALAVVHSISLPPGLYGGDAVERFFTNRLDHGAHPYFESLRERRVSAHFFVRRDGRVVQFVSCDERAWHAGVSSWAGHGQCNDYSIGIEIEGLEGQTFEPAQYAALAHLLRSAARRYPIDAVVGHEHIAPGRKGDPGCGFDWRGLRLRLPWPTHALAPIGVPRAMSGSPHGVRYR
ncbi:MAG: 1,6-anhydro-N-acetylmuramyl-L-alanine amidase AmpD [Burkholderiaceae bacterium]|nr:1,6-anhydro-N-acetylmuramyl-L-alanine amidase AmpD [Burkholderiaceae bacterium]